MSFIRFNIFGSREKNPQQNPRNNWLSLKKETVITAIDKLCESELYGEVVTLIFKNSSSRIKEKEDRASMFVEIQEALSNCKILDIPPSEDTVKVIGKFIDDIEDVPEWSKVKDVLKECYTILISTKVEPKESDPFLQQAKELITHLQRECIWRLHNDCKEAQKLANRDTRFHFADEMKHAQIQNKNWPLYTQKCQDHIVLLEKIIKKEITRSEATENLIEKISDEFLMIAKNPAYESKEFHGFRQLMKDTSEKFQDLSVLARKKSCCEAFFRF